MRTPPPPTWQGRFPGQAGPVFHAFRLAVTGTGQPGRSVPSRQLHRRHHGGGDHPYAARGPPHATGHQQAKAQARQSRQLHFYRREADISGAWSAMRRDRRRHGGARRASPAAARTERTRMLSRYVYSCRLTLLFRREHRVDADAARIPAPSGRQGPSPWPTSDVGPGTRRSWTVKLAVLLDLVRAAQRRDARLRQAT